MYISVGKQVPDRAILFCGGVIITGTVIANLQMIVSAASFTIFICYFYLISQLTK